MSCRFTDALVGLSNCWFWELVGSPVLTLYLCFFVADCLIPGYGKLNEFCISGLLFMGVLWSSDDPWKGNNLIFLSLWLSEVLYPLVVWSRSGTNSILGITLVPHTASVCLGGGEMMLCAGREEEGLQIAWKMDREGRSAPKCQTHFNI